MDVTISHLHGPEGSVGDERVELTVRTAHGFEVTLSVWADQMSAPWVTVTETTPDGETIDLIDSAEQAGRALERTARRA